MIAIIDSPELIEILTKDAEARKQFVWESGIPTCYVSITNVVYVLDHHGLQLKLVRRGIDLIIQTAGVQDGSL